MAEALCGQTELDVKQIKHEALRISLWCALVVLVVQKTCVEYLNVGD